MRTKREVTNRHLPFMSFMVNKNPVCRDGKYSWRLEACCYHSQSLSHGSGCFRVDSCNSWVTKSFQRSALSVQPSVGMEDCRAALAMTASFMGRAVAYLLIFPSSDLPIFLLSYCPTVLQRSGLASRSNAVFKSYQAKRSCRGSACCPGHVLSRRFCPGSRAGGWRIFLWCLACI